MEAGVTDNVSWVNSSDIEIQTVSCNVTAGRFYNRTALSNFTGTEVSRGNFSADNATLTDELWENQLSEKLWQIVPPFLLAIGLTGNIFVMAVLRIMRFTQVVALFFFFVMAVSDCSVLLVVLLRYWLLYAFDVDIRALSDAGCKIIFFLTYFLMDLSAWTLTAVTVERCLVIKFPLRSETLVTIKRARVSMVVIIVILALINGYLLFTQRLKGEKCGSFEEDGFTYFFDEHVFVWIDCLVLSILPFCVMLVCNIIIVKEVRGNVSRHKNIGPKDAKKDHSTNTVSSITLMLLAVNFYFVFTTVPISIYFILDTFLSSTMKADPAVEARMELYWTVSYLLQFTNYSLNFYLYVARGRRFRAAFWKLFKRNSNKDSILESRRMTYGDITTDTTAVRRGTISEALNLLRRGTVADAFSHFRRGTVADLTNGGRRATFTEGISAININHMSQI